MGPLVTSHWGFLVGISMSPLRSHGSPNWPINFNIHLFLPIEASSHREPKRSYKRSRKGVFRYVLGRGLRGTYVEIGEIPSLYLTSHYQLLVVFVFIKIP